MLCSVHADTAATDTGNGRALLLALIGDKLLDTIFYEQLIRGGERNASRATMRRSMVLSNSNLASAMDTLTAGIVSKRAVSLMSQREKGTTVEACVGASYELDDFKMTDRVRDVTEMALHTLIEELDNGCEGGHVGETYDASVQKARSKLLEIMQKCGMSHKASRLSPFRYEECTRESNSNPRQFVATFLPRSVGGVQIGKVSSGPCSSKKEAAEETSKLILSFLHGKCLKEQ